MHSPNADCLDKEGLRKVLRRLDFATDDERFDWDFEQWDTNKDGRTSRDECVGICDTVIDNDRQGIVVLKFMKNKEQFQREAGARKDYKLDPQQVCWHH
jgi:hypothetical protein